jgi:hypothetical protein
MMTAEELAIELVNELSPEDVGVYLIRLSDGCREYYLQKIQQQNLELAAMNQRFEEFQKGLERSVNKPRDPSYSLEREIPKVSRPERY